MSALPGIHHVTAITADAQRNLNFYVGVLGLRLVKQTVNFDVPDTYHLYYGDRVGTPGSAMTFFGWPHLPPGPQGAGQVTLVSFAVPPRSLRFWRERLDALGVARSNGMRFGVPVVALADPDGIALELVAAGTDARWVPFTEGPVPRQHAIRGFHSVALTESVAGPTLALLGDTMGLRPLATDGSRWRFELGEGGPGAIVDVVEAPEVPAGTEVAGSVHHVAWRAPGAADQLEWRTALVRAGLNVTPVIDRKYFQSIYFREPGGVLFEIATDEPGFLVDEPVDDLGKALQLPPQLEGTRADLTVNLPPIKAPNPGGG